MAYGPSHGDIEHSSRSHAAHELSLSIQNDKAVQVVAAQASNRDDCIELLAMLGLNAKASRLAVSPSPLS
jgi:hypothetical protein